MTENDDRVTIVTPLDVLCRCKHLNDLEYPELVGAVENLRNRSEVTSLDWKSELASWLTRQFVDASSRDEIWPFSENDVSLTAVRRDHIHSLNILLTQISGPAVMASEIARSVGLSASNTPLSLASFVSKTDADFASDWSRPVNDTDQASDRTIGRILESLCLVLLAALQARDDYKYDQLLDVLSLCDAMPFQFTTDDFVVFRCLKRIAWAGQSRTKEADLVKEYVSLDGWRKIADSIQADSRVVHPSMAEDSLGPCTAYPLLILVSAIGHMRRQHAATELTPKIIHFVLHQVQKFETCCTNAGKMDVILLSRHHALYYQYFGFHILAVGIVEMYGSAKHLTQAVHVLKDSTDDSEDPVPTDWYDCACLAYETASVSIEHALSLVPQANSARRDYYELTGENLEHEMSLRLEMFEGRIEMEKRVEILATSHVATAVNEAKSSLHDELRIETTKLHGELRSISMRVIEIIGVFLAIVAFVATTVISGTAGDLSLGERILILCIGGLISLTYFGLLRLIVLRPVAEDIDETKNDELKNRDTQKSGSKNGDTKESGAKISSRQRFWRRFFR